MDKRLRISLWSRPAVEKLRSDGTSVASMECNLNAWPSVTGIDTLIGTPRILIDLSESSRALSLKASNWCRIDGADLFASVPLLAWPESELQGLRTIRQSRLQCERACSETQRLLPLMQRLSNIG